MNESEPKQVLRIALLSVWGLVTLILVCVVGIQMFKMRQYEENIPKVDTSNSVAVSTRTTTSTPAAKPTVPVDLYFASTNETVLAVQSKNLVLTNSTVNNCRMALESLIMGPSSKDFSPIISPKTGIRAMYLRENNELVIDFSREIEAGHAHSASADLLLVHGISNTLTQPSLQGGNDRAVQSIRFLFEGSPYQGTFPAHYDLSDAVTMAMNTVTNTPEGDVDAQ